MTSPSAPSSPAHNLWQPSPQQNHASSETSSPANLQTVSPQGDTAAPQSKLTDESSSSSHNQPSSTLAIRYLHIKGFKSYKEPQLIPLTSSVNVVIGSNGSGKSNIIDAFGFLFGFESRMLRSSNLKALICRGESKAEVTMFAEVNDTTQQQDNLPSKQLCVRRVVTASGRSQYFIAHAYQHPSPADVSFQKSTHSHIASLLKSHGIDLSFPERFMILQHHTIQIAQQTPIDLLNHFETLFDTAPLKDKVYSLQQNAESHMQQLTVLNDNLQHTESKMQEMKPALQALKGFRQMEANNETLRTEYAHKHLALLTHQLNLEQEKVEELRENKKTIKNVQRKQNKKMDEYTSALKSAKKSCKQQQKKTLKLTNELEEMESKIACSNVELEHCNQSLQEDYKLSESIQEQLSSLNEEKSEKESELVALCEEQQHLEDKIHRASGSYTIPDDQFEELISLRAKQIQCGKMNNIHREEETNLSNKLSSLQQQLDNNQEQKQKLKSHLSAKIGDLQEANQKISTLDASIRTKEDLCQRIQASIERKRHAPHSVDRHNYDARLHVQINRLKDDIPGVHGLVSQLATVPEDFSTRRNINMVLQNARNDIVVNSYESAMSVIQHFSSSSLGSIKCHILECIQNPPADEDSFAPGHTPEDPAPLISCVEPASPRYSPLFSMLLRNWYQCSNAKEAARASWNQRKNVVCEGNLYLANGDVRVFDSHYEPTCLQSEREVGRNPTTMDEQQDSSAQEQSELTHHLQELKALSNQRKNICRDIEEITGQKLHLSMQIKQLEKEYTCTVEEIHSIEVSLESLQSTEHSATLSAQEFSTLQDARDSLSTHQNSVLEQCAQLKYSLSENHLHQSDLKERILLITASIDSLKKKQSSNQKQINQLETSQDDIQETIDDYCSTKEQLSTSLQDEETALQNLVEERKKLKKKLKRVKLDDSKQNKKLQQLKQQLREHFKSVTTLKSELATLRAEYSECLPERESYEAQDSSPSTDDSQDWQHRLFKDLSDCIHHIQTMQEEIKQKRIEMEYKRNSINFDAEHKYQLLSAQYHSQELERKQKMHLIDRLLQEAKQQQQKRFHLFMRNCHVINSYLSRIFRQLTVDPSSDCHLKISDQSASTCFESGVQILSKQGGSEWKPFGMLSGGQQASVACALALSLQKKFPCPLLLTDEVDASLDQHRVENLSRVIQEQNRGRQMLLVSLRPQIYDSARSILGVYQSRGASRVISLCERQLSVMAKTKE